MKSVRKVQLFFGVAILLLAAQSQAQTPTAVMKQFSQFAGGGQGLYWVPSSGPISNVAFRRFTGPAIISCTCPPRSCRNGASAFSA